MLKVMLDIMRMSLYAAGAVSNEMQCPINGNTVGG